MALLTHSPVSPGVYQAILDALGAAKRRRS
jgi:hypothetical protein